MNTKPQPAREPSNPEAELALIGSLLLDGEAIWQVRPIVRATDFHDKRNGQVFAAILGLSEKGEAVDVITVSDALDGALSGIEGMQYLTGAMTSVPSAINAPTYAATVSEAARRRAGLRLVSELARRFYNPAEDIDRTLTWAAMSLQESGRGGVLKHASDVIQTVYAELERNAKEPLQSGEVRGLDTGWRDLNAKLQGWKPGLYVVLGEPHVGKSWFALEAAQNVAERGHRALVFSLEMTAVQLVRRLCLAWAGLSQRDYDLGRIDQQRAELFYERQAQISTWNLDIADDMETASEIFSTIHRECRGPNPPAFIAIDYLGLIVTDDNEENNNYRLSALLRGLKKLSNQCQVPIIVPHQISDKAVEMRQDKRPKKSDGYATGGVAQHSDVILGLYREALHNENCPNPNVMEVIVLKDRLGGESDPYASVELHFSKTGGLRDARYYEPAPEGAIR
jgi:replicative DNA helicase